MSNKHVIGVLLAAMGAISFSTKAIFIKLAYASESVDALSLLVLRMAFSLPIYLLVLIVLWWQSKISVDRRTFMRIALLAIVGYYGASFLDFEGLNYLTASMERLILFVYPTFVVLINFLVYKKPIRIYQIIAIGLTYAGLLVVFWDHIGKPNEGVLAIGTALILASAIAYAIYLVGSEQLLKRVGVLSFTSTAMVISALAVFVHYSFTRDVHALTVFSKHTYMYAGAIAVFATVIPSFLVSKAISLLGSSQVSVIGSLGPVATVTGAWLFLNEPLSANLIIGAALVISGVVYLTLKKE